MAFERSEPFGDARGDLQAGIVASTVSNTHRDPKRSSKPFSADEFMPRFERQAQTPEEQLAIVKMISEAMGQDDQGTRRPGDQGTWER
jgi:hypothetical protein